jgi:hypothetical protein
MPKHLRPWLYTLLYLDKIGSRCHRDCGERGRGLAISLQVKGFLVGHSVTGVKCTDDARFV